MTLEHTTLVSITAPHGEIFVGQIKDDDRETLGEGKPVTLHDVRVLFTQTATNDGGTGIQQMAILLPPPMYNGPAPSLRLIPSSWSYPGDDEIAKDNVRTLLQAAEENELRNKAARLNIVMPGSGMSGPGGMGHA